MDHRRTRSIRLGAFGRVRLACLMGVASACLAGATCHQIAPGNWKIETASWYTIDNVLTRNWWVEDLSECRVLLTRPRLHLSWKTSKDLAAWFVYKGRDAGEARDLLCSYSQDADLMGAFARAARRTAEQAESELNGVIDCVANLYLPWFWNDDRDRKVEELRNLREEIRTAIFLLDAFDDPTPDVLARKTRCLTMVNYKFADFAGVVSGLDAHDPSGCITLTLSTDQPYINWSTSDRADDPSATLACASMAGSRGIIW